MGVAVRPLKHDSPLIVHANTMKAFPVSPQHFETVSRKRSEIPKLMGSVDQIELSEHSRRNVRGDTPGTSRAPPMIEIRRGLVAERDDHEVGSYRLHGIRATGKSGMRDMALSGRRRTATCYLTARDSGNHHAEYGCAPSTWSASWRTTSNGAERSDPAVQLEPGSARNPGPNPRREDSEPL